MDIQVSKLKLLKANHTSQRYRLEDNIAKHYPMQITALKERLEGYRTDIQTYTAHNSALHIITVTFQSIIIVSLEDRC